jgi:hypothetical protein
MAIKTFTSGSVLTAADTNTYLANSGMTYVGEFTASGTSRALVCDNVFTSTYSHYRVVFSLSALSNTNGLYFQYIDSGGTTVTAGYYSSAYGQDFTTGVTAFGGVLNGTTAVFLGYIPNSTTARIAGAVEIYNPNVALVTNTTGQYSGIASGAAYFGGASYSMTTGTTVMRGIRFDNGGATNLTGKVQIYGYRIA